MQRTLVAALLLGGPTVAWGGAGLEAHLVAVREPPGTGPGDDPQPARAPAEEADPTHCAKKAELVGSNCSFSTGLMAQRVLDEGRPYTFVGTLAPSGAELGSRVAVPYLIGPANDIHVVANEILEALVSSGGEDRRVSLVGRVLEVDGVLYFVATGFDARA